MTESRRYALRWVLLAGLLLVGFASLAPTASADDSDVYFFSSRPGSTEAGGHPDVITEMELANKRSPNSLPTPCECHDPKDIEIHTPAGVIANPHVVSVCSAEDLLGFECSADSQVGLSIIHIVFPNNLWIVLPMYRTVPQTGQAALFAFSIPALVPIPQYISVNARTGGDFGLDFRLLGIKHAAPPAYTATIFWGVPGAEKNDRLRFGPRETSLICVTKPTAEILAGKAPPNCIFEAAADNGEAKLIDKQPIPSSLPVAPFTQNPTACLGPLGSSLDVRYYDHAIAHATDAWPATTGCDKLSFAPSLAAAPTTEEGDAPSGLAVDLKVPQFQDPGTPSPSELKATTVQLPAGFSINPGAADGKTTCSDAQANFGNEEAAQCPEYSKIGTAELASSALPGPIFGYIYLGTPLPGNRWRIIVTASGFGTNIKLAGSATLDPQGGQVVTKFMDLPQSPLQEFNLHFFGSERGLFATPTQCGTYAVKSTFTPWAAEISDQTSTQFFSVNSGPEGSPCPNGPRPFSPSIGAGVEDNTAGAHSPFSLEVRRVDGDQYLNRLDVTAPPGFLATLRGVSLCPEAAIAQMQTAGYTGQAEQESPPCPANSQVGSVIAGAGAGTHPVYVPGHVYLAGPYKGAPLSLIISIPALSGPYDLGVVAVRAALDVDRETAQVRALSDPIPLIQEGVPLRTRFIRINLDRPGFAVNPTNCDPFSVQTSLFGDEGAVASPSSHFQIANCGDLAFSPKVALKVTRSKRRAHPALRAVVTSEPGDANIAKTVVALPDSLILDNGHIGTPCTRTGFAAEQCPASSRIGYARASTPLLDQPLEGPVYLRTNPSRGLPDLAVSLRGTVDIDLVGRIDSPRGSGLRTTFSSVPDAPITKFSLWLKGGKKGLLQNTDNLCAAPQEAKVRMDGQNGLSDRLRVGIGRACGKGRLRERRRHGHIRTANNGIRGARR
jgi:hypothetical protein